MGQDFFAGDAVVFRRGINTLDATVLGYDNSYDEYIIRVFINCDEYTTLWVSPCELTLSNIK
jgi:hypothetical protein